MKIQLQQVNKPQAIFSYSSLTDIVLLLLIFFLLTSSFIVSTGIKVHLPAASNTTATDINQIVISLLKSGDVYINANRSSMEKLSVDLQQVITDPEHQVIVLSSDKEVPLERAVFVLDAAKNHGATRFFISTQQTGIRNDNRK